MHGSTCSLPPSPLQEDEIAQHYAVKTVENICSQGGEWAARFASQDVVMALVQVYSAGRGEHLKATTASTLARLLRCAHPAAASSASMCTHA